MEPYRGVYQRVESPLLAPPKWSEFASCLVEDITSEQLEDFYAPDLENERPNEKDRREDRAKDICRTCPVILKCRAHALSQPELEGVWGGLGEDERALILERHGGQLTYPHALTFDRPVSRPKPLLTRLQAEAVQFDAIYTSIQQCATAAGVTHAAMRDRLREAQKALGTKDRKATIAEAARLGLILLPSKK